MMTSIFIIWNNKSFNVDTQTMSYYRQSADKWILLIFTNILSYFVKILWESLKSEKLVQLSCLSKWESSNYPVLTPVMMILDMSRLEQSWCRQSLMTGTNNLRLRLSQLSQPPCNILSSVILNRCRHNITKVVNYPHLYSMFSYPFPCHSCLNDDRIISYTKLLKLFQFLFLCFE